MRTWLAALALACGFPVTSHAIDRLRLNAEEVIVAGVTAHAVQAELAIPSARRSVLNLTAKEIDLPAGVRSQTGRLTNVKVHCDDPVVREPAFACPRLRLEAQAARLPPLQIEGEAHFDSGRGSLDMAGRGPTLAGVELLFTFSGTPDHWDAGATLPSLELKQLAELVAPWFEVPAATLPGGRAALTFEAQAREGNPQATVRADLNDLQYSNPEGTMVVDSVKGRVHARLIAFEHPDAEFNIEATSGQLLAGPVFVDLAAHPIEAVVRATQDEDVLQIASLDVTQRDLLHLGGTARLRREPFGVEAAQIEVTDLKFPAAYRSLMQIALTTTPFAQLETSGTARASLRIADDKPVALDLRLDGVSFADAKQQLEVKGLAGEVHWTAGLTGPPRPSFLAWEGSRGWGVVGGKTRIDFQTTDRDVRLLKPARLPLWDGALLVRELEALNLGSDRLAGSFVAEIEPISLQPVTRAFGWPEFSGRVAGRIPGLTYRDRLLTLQGDLEAEVFDGRVTARNLRVRDPLGAFPRLYADVSARNLDLDLITRTFEFGNITGRLDGDMTGLETFNWSPVAFDLRLATPERDRSRHRISQKAVKNLSNIGGGGGGVAAALQSGALRFFENFRYDRIGLACRLKDDVCRMDGVEPAKDGYYIVKGSGLPRIDIIGNQTRVDWPLLMAQLSAALANKDDIVVN